MFSVRIYGYRFDWIEFSKYASELSIVRIRDIDDAVTRLSYRTGL